MLAVTVFKLICKICVENRSGNLGRNFSRNWSRKNLFLFYKKLLECRRKFCFYGFCWIVVYCSIWVLCLVCSYV